MNKADIISFFDRLSAEWDIGCKKDRQKIGEILDCAGVKEGVSVLDIACGTGVMFGYYLERGAQKITGADISQGMLSCAKKKISNDKRVKLICADAEEYAFEECYDCCMVFNAFPHFCNAEKLLLNLKRALKDGGTLTVAHDRGREAIDAHHKGSACKVSNGLLPAAELAELFVSCGFEITNVTDTDEIYIVSGKKQV